ncbi:sensor histidine kinase [Microbacterium invictum]|uniref:Sensor-like histidine kinase SenX3 n=1 Tax=Microbacterium invictum TaxID=515415 RepID=A0AA40SLJ9_9MICO|nr:MULTISPECIES: ATP-binding protein [Microbacterium]MBB4138476.1 two-component system sensor histidine kinase SenX3 [Microbacterium invictum]
MDTTAAALLALAVGVVVGVAIAWIVVQALRARRTAGVQASTEIPDGAHAVLGAMDDAAVIVDSSMSIAVASAAAGLFGLREGQILPDELRTLARAARAHEKHETATLRLRRGVEMRSVVARAGSVTPRMTLVIVRDITERERVEEMRRDFVANTSHELKTPVGAISLLSEAVESAADDPAQVRHFASRLMAEATRLSQLTARIMDLSRLQSDTDLTDLRDVSIDEVVTSAIESQAIAADSAGIEVVRGGARGLYVRGDVHILSEAIGNLVANAIAYSPAGGRVGVGVKNGDGTVEIAVTDRGIGIPDAEQDRVFERFYRADQARSRRTGGTGLGLSIVKHAVQRHGGVVELWSRPGRGSTFTVRLATVAAPEPTVVKKKRKKKPVDRAKGEAS